ncbi:MAG: rhomboid family intramembrane serine protease [Cyclobacteriaceae bacterium]|nr:rhomboid family intramembrane serine protease [Cyclobacteriaceae bacterium]
MNSLIDDVKMAWNKPNNGLTQIIIINVVVYVFLGLTAVIATFSGLDQYFKILYRQFSIPGDFNEFIFKPWTIITYAFSHSLMDFFHILFNMLILYWFGRVFVDYLGSQKMVNLYIMGAIAGAIVYLLAFNLLPHDRIPVGSYMVGASAAVYAISVAAATLVPDHTFYMLFFGPVRIKYLVGISIFLSLLGSIGSNAGGNLAHLGGALIGFIYIKQLQSGNEMGVWVFKSMEFVKSFFIPRSPIKVSHKSKNTAKTAKKGAGRVDQAEIDLILDKISEKGYDSLTKEEKQKLFNASKH